MIWMKRIGQLPKWMLTVLAWKLTVLACLLGGYRGKVVRANLKRAFPGASGWTRAVWFVTFQRHFMQLLVESAKLFTMSQKDVESGMPHHNVEVVQALHDQGKHVLVAGGHMNNWEWSAVTLNQALPHRSMALYKKLSDPKADKLMRSSRQRFGLEMVPTKEGRAWMNVAQHGNPVAVVMGFDQSPADPSKSWWTTFLGTETAVFYGLEQWSKLYDMAVVYASIRRHGPWKYSLTYELICDGEERLGEGEVLDRCLAKLEREIAMDPPRWLWSHKRWKHNRPEKSPVHPRRHRPEPRT